MKKKFIPFSLFIVLILYNIFNFAQENADAIRLQITEVPEISGGAEFAKMLRKTINSGAQLQKNFENQIKNNLYENDINPEGEIFTIEGIDFDENNTVTGSFHVPPDPSGAAGPSHVVSVVNTSIAWYTKVGVNENIQRLGRNASTAVGSFFESLSPLTGTFDPKVIYDQYDERFVVVSLESTDTSDGDAENTSRILIAVSDDTDPNGTWYFHAIDSKISISGTDTWADYPGLAVDDGAIYITANMYKFEAGGGDFGGERLWIVDKIPLYSGGAGVETIHDPFTDAGVGFATTAQPAHMFGTAPPNVGTFLSYYSGLTSMGNEFVGVIRVDDPLGSPVFTNQFVIAGDIDLTDSTNLPDAPQMDTSTTIEVNNRRTLNAVWRDDSLWISTTVLPPAGDDAGETTAHWFKINTINLASLAISDQGNVGGEDIAPGTFTFFPSLAVNGDGVMVIGFSASAPTIYPGSYFAVRLSTDSPGVVGPTGVLKSGLDFYERFFGTTRNRWGDYSGMSLDPSDEKVFWVFNEYAIERGTSFGGEDGRWGTAFGEIIIDVIIPVELVNFLAKAANSKIELLWTTATETNNFGFEIERKALPDIYGSAYGEWEKIGFISGSGTTIESKTYTFVDNKVSEGKYLYRLKQINYDGSYSYSSVIEVSSKIKFSFNLAQNYPNPFNPETKIGYTIPQEANVKLSIFNPLGEVVTELVKGIKSPDFYEVIWNAGNFTSGIYFYTLEVIPVNGEKGYKQSRKMILLH